MNFKKNIYWILMISVVVTIAGCNEQEEKVITHSPLSIDEMAEFGISSIEPIDFSVLEDDNQFKPGSINDSAYLVEYIGFTNKTVIKQLPDNKFNLYFYNEQNELIRDATITIENLDDKGYINKFSVSSGSVLTIAGNRYTVNHSSKLRGYGRWADCVGNAVTDCYTADLGCATLFTVVFPFAFSAVMIACV